MRRFSESECDDLERDSQRDDVGLGTSGVDARVRSLWTTEAASVSADGVVSDASSDDDDEDDDAIRIALEVVRRRRAQLDDQQQRHCRPEQGVVVDEDDDGPMTPSSSVDAGAKDALVARLEEELRVGVSGDRHSVLGMERELADLVTLRTALQEELGGLGEEMEGLKGRGQASLEAAQAAAVREGEVLANVDLLGGSQDLRRVAAPVHLVVPESLKLNGRGRGRGDVLAGGDLSAECDERRNSGRSSTLTTFALAGPPALTDDTRSTLAALSAAEASLMATQELQAELMAGLAKVRAKVDELKAEGIGPGKATATDGLTDNLGVSTESGECTVVSLTVGNNSETTMT